MSVAETSKQAYEKIMDKLGDKQEQVYEAIKALGTATNDDVAEYLNWPINRVTGRCTELRNYELIAVVGIGKSKAGFSAKVWMAKDFGDRQLKMI